MTTTEATRQLIEIIGQTPARSAWSRGVRDYAQEIAENLQYLDELADFSAPRIVEKALLNGAQNWKHYSEGGCSLFYDEDIARRLCTPSELKRLQHREGGFRNPNSRETWLECQAHALCQAAHLVKSTLQTPAFLEIIGR